MIRDISHICQKTIKTDNLFLRPNGNCYIHKEIQQYTRLRKQCNHSNVLNITWLTAKNELVKFLDSTLEGQYEKLV